MAFQAPNGRFIAYAPVTGIVCGPECTVIRDYQGLLCPPQVPSYGIAHRSMEEVVCIVFKRITEGHWS